MSPVLSTLRREIVFTPEPPIRPLDLEELLPEARIVVGHGQLPERELERVMRDFTQQRANLLLCTTIIETGINIPTANTIIIHRADRFGLAQLHQLRGRVGRSHHRAYAYLVVPDKKAMTSDAGKRLEALASLEELGAYPRVSSRDERRLTCVRDLLAGNKVCQRRKKPIVVCFA